MRLHRKRLFQLSLLSAFAVVGCGYEPSFMPAVQPPNFDLATPQQLTNDEVVANSYIVAFKTGVVGGEVKLQSYAKEYAANYMPLVSRFMSDPRVKDIHYITTIDLARDDSEEWKADFSPPIGMQLMFDQTKVDSVPASIAKVDFASHEDAATTLAEWDATGSFWYAEPNYRSTLSAKPFDNIMIDDYGNLQQAWFGMIKLTQAFTVLGAKTSVDEVPIVAVMDSGVDYNHPALSNNMWVNSVEGQSGCQGDKYGCNTTVAKKGELGNGDVYPLFTNGPGETCPVDANNKCVRGCCHGTHVAGIIAGAVRDASGNPTGIGGVCPVCKIMAIRIVEKGDNGKDTITDSAIIAGLKYITRFRQSNNALAVRVINASFGKFQRSKTTAAQIRVLSKVGSGTLLVGAAGNEDTMKMTYPAGYNDAVAVANLNADRIRSTSSNYGRWVDIAAPGTQIVSTIPNNATEAKTGTSMAAPVVAGVAALMLVNEPGLGFNELRNKLITTADGTIYSANSVNQQYYPKIAGEIAPVPLLGSGLVSAEGAITGKTAGGLPVAKPLDRVSERCGTLDLSTGHASRKVWLTLVLLLLPVFIGLLVAGRTKTVYNADRQQNQI